MPLATDKFAGGSTMSKFTKRILLAAGISASGFAATFGWYYLTATNSFGSRGSKPVARIVTFVNEVQRKPVTKLIWQPISENEILYAGEAIRTGVDAEAAIEFLNSKTRIDLDPDSAIVLEESTTGDLALNFISGNMNIKSDEASGSGLTLKSGGKNIALGKSEVNLGKAEGQDLNLQVLKGSAQVDVNGKTITLDESKSMSGDKIIEVLQPNSEVPIYIDPNIRELVDFKWTPLNEAYQVTVEVGPTRNSLKPVPGAIAQGNLGTMKVAMKMGRIYYRLVAKSTNPALPALESPTFKNSVFAKTPPTLLEPENEAAVAVNLQQPTLRFAWTTPSDFEKAVFEISSEPTMKKIVLTKEIKNTSEFFLDIKTPGKLYWQVSGYLKGIPEPVKSSVFSFNLQVNKELPAPIITSPLANEKVPFDRIKENGLPFEWQSVPGVIGYILNVKAKDASMKIEPIEVKTKLSKVKVKGLVPGDFEWTVTSVSRTEKSKPSTPTVFALTELPTLQWADNKTEDDQYYLSLRPTAAFKWLKGPAGTAKYKIRYTPDGQAFTSESFSKILGEQNIEIEFPKDGKYLVEVEALTNKGDPLARTPRRTLRVLPAPLLPAPLFADSLPQQIEASKRGLAEIQWNKVQGANEYVLSVKTTDGEKLKEYRFNQVAGALKGLMPGDYKVSLKSVDEHGRQGPEGEERILRVPATSDMRAPKVKGFKVK